MADTPKSAYELAMERLKAMDREEGVVETPLDEEQKKAIADARQACAAELAQLEILLADRLRAAADRETAARLREEFQTDRRRCEDDRDRKIARIRKAS